MSLLLIAEWMGSIFGVAGAALISSNTKHSPWGWWLFLASSCALCGYAVMQQAWGLLMLHGCFVATNLTGLARVWLPHYRATVASRPAAAEPDSIN